MTGDLPHGQLFAYLGLVVIYIGGGVTLSFLLGKSDFKAAERRHGQHCQCDAAASLGMRAAVSPSYSPLYKNAWISQQCQQCARARSSIPNDGTPCVIDSDKTVTIDAELQFYHTGRLGL